MAGSPVFQCVGPSYYLSDKKAAVQRSVNCFPKRLDGDTWMMASSPGALELINGDPVRGSHKTFDNRWFIVAGTTLYEQATDGSRVSRGTVGGSGYVGMDDNKTQLCIVNGPQGFILNLSSGVLTDISLNPGWRGSDDVYEMDGYFIFVDPDTDQFYLSAIDDGTDLNALDFSSADSSPDDIVTHRISHRQAWFFGQLSAEIWINTGGADFPLSRYDSYILDIGIVGKRAAIVAADTLFWVGQTDRGTGIVYMASGNQPQRVSTTAVEEALRSSTDLSGTKMWAYQVAGHEFIGVTAPGLETTWVYDAAMQQWHEEAEWSDGWQPSRVEFVVSIGNDHYTADAQGQVCRLDFNVNNLAGRVLKRERTWPHLKQPSMEPVSYLGLEAQMKSGYGGVVTLEISNDGGVTFGSPLPVSLGAIGRWMQRIRWNRLGSAINRVFRIRCTDDVPFAIHSCTVNTK